MLLRDGYSIYFASRFDTAPYSVMDAPIASDFVLAKDQAEATSLVKLYDAANGKSDQVRISVNRAVSQKLNTYCSPERMIGFRLACVLPAYPIHTQGKEDATKLVGRIFHTSCGQKNEDIRSAAKSLYDFWYECEYYSKTALEFKSAGLISLKKTLEGQQAGFDAEDRLFSAAGMFNQTMSDVVNFPDATAYDDPFISTATVKDDRYADSLMTSPEDYDAIETQCICESVDPIDGAPYCEPVSSDENPDFFSVYLHRKSGGVECVGDFGTKALGWGYAQHLSQKYGYEDIYDFGDFEPEHEVGAA